MAVQLFLSCVSDEFGDYRDPLRKALTRPDVAVKIQEDFKALGGDTLSKLDEYIASCEAVVHFVGEKAGWAPPDFCVRELLDRYPDLSARLPPLREAIEAGRAVSATQWEAWLALYHRRDLVIAAPDPKLLPTKAAEASQAEHIERLKAIGRYVEIKFTNEDNLVAQIYASAVLKALVKAVAAPQGRPRNLPYLSLGDLFVGRESALGELRAALVGGTGQGGVGGADAARARRGQRTGSNRHDGGNAADPEQIANGRKLDFTDAGDLAAICRFVATSASAPLSPGASDRC